MLLMENPYTLIVKDRKQMVLIENPIYIDC